MSAPDFEFVEGATSDLAFVARGATEAEALIAASEALLAATLEDPATVADAVSQRVKFEEADRDLLLLRLLNELVYLRDAEGLLLRARRVDLVRGPEAIRLEAELAGERIDPARHHLTTEVKAATAHGLSLEPSDEGWQACATLDV